MVMYGDSDLQRYKLESQLSLLAFDIADLLDFLQSLENARKFPLSEIWTLAKLMLAYQRHQRPLSQSALKRVKTTKEASLILLMLLHVHKELADGIDMVEVNNLFVRNN